MYLTIKRKAEIHLINNLEFLFRIQTTWSTKNEYSITVLSKYKAVSSNQLKE